MAMVMIMTVGNLYGTYGYFVLKQENIVIDKISYIRMLRISILVIVKNRCWQVGIMCTDWGDRCRLNVKY